MSMGDAPESYAAELEGERLAALEQAVRGAQGVRRLVLSRRLGDARIEAGKAQEALDLLNGLPRGACPASPLPAGELGQRLKACFRSPLDDWNALSPEDAHLAAELVRAEALSHLLRAEDAAAAFGNLEKRLTGSTSLAVAHLWVRWARAWSWVLCEVLGQPAQAVAACEKVRARVPAEVLARDAHALGLIRAQEVAISAVGDIPRAQELIDEHLALAERLGEKRELSLGFNARAIVQYGRGELLQARASFERAVALAKEVGWTRREAVSTHNLALVLTELGELDAADAAEQTYERLSLKIENISAKAEVPVVLAGVALARGNLAAADKLIAEARRAAEDKGWPMLLLQARALAGRRSLLVYLQERDRLSLTRARNDLLAVVDGLEEHHTAWSEELDPAEVYAEYAAVLSLSGHAGAAREVLARGEAAIPPSNVLSHRTLAVGQAFVEGRGFDEAVAWLAERGFARRAALWRAFR